MTDFAHRWFTSDDGLSLYARDYAAASGPARLPVVAIHGLTRNSADFGHIAARIAESGRRVIAVDVRGRGRSERAADPMTYQPDTYAKDVVCLFEQLGLKEAIFLGTSMGGLITMALTGLQPKLIAAATQTAGNTFVVKYDGATYTVTPQALSVTINGNTFRTETWADFHGPQAPASSSTTSSTSTSATASATTSATATATTSASAAPSTSSAPKTSAAPSTSAAPLPPPLPAEVGASTPATG